MLVGLRSLQLHDVVRSNRVGDIGCIPELWGNKLHELPKITTKSGVNLGIIPRGEQLKQLETIQTRIHNFSDHSFLSGHFTSTTTGKLKQVNSFIRKMLLENLADPEPTILLPNIATESMVGCSFLTSILWDIFIFRDKQ